MRSLMLVSAATAADVNIGTHFAKAQNECSIYMKTIDTSWLFTELQKKEFDGYRITTEEKETFLWGCQGLDTPPTQNSCQTKVQQIKIGAQNYASQSSKDMTLKLCDMYGKENAWCTTLCQLQKQLFFKPCYGEQGEGDCLVEVKVGGEQEILEFDDDDLPSLEVLEQNFEDEISQKVEKDEPNDKP